MKYSIRRGGFGQQPYLARDGTWVKWADAAKFATQDEAVAHAERFGVENYGLFQFDLAFPVGVKTGGGE